MILKIHPSINKTKQLMKKSFILRMKKTKIIIQSQTYPYVMLCLILIDKNICMKEQNSSLVGLPDNLPTVKMQDENSNPQQKSYSFNIRTSFNSKVQDQHLDLPNMNEYSSLPQKPADDFLKLSQNSNEQEHRRIQKMVAQRFKKLVWPKQTNQNKGHLFQSNFVKVPLFYLSKQS